MYLHVAVTLVLLPVLDLGLEGQVLGLGLAV